MQSLWNDSEAQTYAHDPLELRVYTSRLLGADPALVLHGGGNTSVKITTTDFFGDSEDVLYVKGSGWDLATIQAAGFAPVRMKTLLRLAEFEHLTDSVIVREQRAALLNPDAPNPSVEAILHAVIPYQYVDHTHADAVVAVTNTPQGEAFIRQIYGERVLIVPYIMPGFPLARRVYELTRGINWDALEGIILLNHGVFTFADDARQSYENMIKLVTEAEQFIAQQGAWTVAEKTPPPPDLLGLSALRGAVSQSAGFPMIARLDDSPAAVGFAALPTVPELATQGTLTPDHIIRTKRIAAVVGDDPTAGVADFVAGYAEYFDRHTDGDLTRLDPAPRWAVWQERGVVTFGESVKNADIAGDIIAHTLAAIQWADHLGGWQALPEKDLFEMEYWELEQAKLKSGGKRAEFAGKVVLVTGAASGIGRACAEAFMAAGAAVLAVDINPEITALFNKPAAQGFVADLTQPEAITSAVAQAVRLYGGLDVLISNAGIFPASYRLEAMNDAAWERSLAINLTSHQRLLTAALPYLRHGLAPTVIFVGSKNFPAPGPGAAAYSVAKAGLTQLARVAALELAAEGIRVNVIHPDAVFDTGIWNDDILEKRAANYGLTVEAYKTKNLLGVEITSRDVARLVVTMAGDAFSKTTGAQVPIDGGNDRVI